MQYISTRGAAPVLEFEATMRAGLARDGGLYVPDHFPPLTQVEIASLAGLSYEDQAAAIMRPFIGDSFTDDAFRALIARAYAAFSHPARAPLKQLAANHFLLELFHGPTLAFKDFAMQLIGQLFEASLARSGGRVTIVGATSGDTGSAAIEAFRGVANVDVFILYPHGRVSEVQRRQMTTPDDSNVHALAIDGDFDTCQALVKDMFNDLAFRDAVGLAGVNSINWARVLAQVVYFFSAAVSLGAGRGKKDDPIDPAVGITLEKKIGDKVEVGQVIAVIQARSETSRFLIDSVGKMIRSAYQYSAGSVTAPPLICGWIDQKGDEHHV